MNSWRLEWKHLTRMTLNATLASTMNRITARWMIRTLGGLNDGYGGKMEKKIKPVLMSLHPKWIELILQGKKTREVRKRAPLQRMPFKVYLYCTKEPEAWMAGIEGKYESYQMNGNVCGEATCVSIVEYRGEFGTHGTCLSMERLKEYAGEKDTLCYMALENPVMYEQPKGIAEFGLERAPQSWCYITDLNDGKGTHE